ncbi:N-acetylmuramoyl-L-alanine amidase [Candidatus Sumerlaeota bacterium]|nr:N-acetylmuramoyl-L-alanine amidase [Candidatus Sumerlaeota bacterium]
MNRRISILIIVPLILLIILGCARIGIPFLWTPNPLRGVRIVIDPGHGGVATKQSPTGGTKGPRGLREPDANLAVALQLKKMLKDAGAKVFLTREVDRRMTPIGSTYSQELHARPAFAVLKDADIFISLHHNAPGPGRNPEEINFTSTYVYTEPTPFEMGLAQAIQHNVVASMGSEDGGVHKGDFHVLRENPVQAVLVEFSFLTNSAEENRVRDTHYNYLEARGVYNGLVTYLRTYNIKKVPLKPLALEQDKERAGYFIDHYVPRLYNPVKGEIDQRFLYGMLDEGGTPRRFISFSVPADTPVYSAWDGEVVYVNTVSQPDPLFPYKNCVVIRHDHVLEGTPIYTVYGNMKTVLAWTYEKVTPETVIGLTDSSDTEETNLKFEVRVGGRGAEFAQNPELWILSVHNREAGYIVGRVFNRKKKPMYNTQIQGVVKVFGYDKTPQLYTYPKGVKGSTFWDETFAISDVLPNPEGSSYHLIIGDREIEVKVQACKVTYINLK